MTGARVQVGIFNSGSRDFTLSLQRKRHVTGAKHIFGNDQLGMSRVTIFIPSSNILTFSCGAANYTSTLTPTSDVWYSAALIQNGGETRFYIEGALVSTSSASTSLNVGYQATVGTKATSNNKNWEGGLQHVKYFDWALPSWTIASLAAHTDPIH